MKTFSEQFGGIGVAIMLHKTDFEIAIGNMSDALDAVTAKLQKLMSADSHKRAGFADQMAALEDIRRDVNGLQEIAERRRVALPAFTAWANNSAVCDNGRRFMLASKAGGTERDNDAELSALWPQRQQEFDPTGNAADVALTRRFSR
jgi:hypothetical protein